MDEMRPGKNAGFRKKNRKGKWYEKYLPFVARSTEKQVEWLLGALRKKTLSSREITPYIKLLLEDDDPEVRLRLRELLEKVGESDWCAMLRAADIYDLPVLIGLMPGVTVEQARLILEKAPPAYEENGEQVLHRVYETLHDRTPENFQQAANGLLASDEAPEHFAAAHERFMEVLRDREFLSTLFPKARS